MFSAVVACIHIALVPCGTFARRLNVNCQIFRHFNNFVYQIHSREIHGRSVYFPLDPAQIDREFFSVYHFHFFHPHSKPKSVLLILYTPFKTEICTFDFAYRFTTIPKYHTLDIVCRQKFTYTVKNAGDVFNNDRSVF